MLGGFRVSAAFALLCYMVSVAERFNLIPPVYVDVGQLRYAGKVETLLGIKVGCFLGIRYAEAPTGKRRFQKPVPSRRTGSIFAGNYGNSCYQWQDHSFHKDFLGFSKARRPNTAMSEDCLFLNVWTPQGNDFNCEVIPKTSTLRPVMVWIHGGGFHRGTSSLGISRGRWLAAAERVVVVSMNYRLGALGFISFGDRDAPGNSGLWDQREALIWVKKNIRNFGGDPSKVTLFGNGAGAASVHFHMISKKSKGLFKNAILQSGSGYSPWAIIPKHVMEKSAHQLAERVRCDDGTKKIRKVISCLQKTPAKTLMQAQVEMRDLGTARFQNAAVVDGDFLTISDVEELQKESFVTDVNVLAGFNKNEGNRYLPYGSEGLAGEIEENNPIDFYQYRKTLQKALHMYPWNPLEKPEAPYNHIEDHHIEHNFSLYAIDFRYNVFHTDLARTDHLATVSRMYNEALDRIISDIQYVCPVVRFLDCGRVYGDKTAASGKMFLYRFLHRSSEMLWPEWMGTVHGYEIEFVFGRPFNESLPYTKQEVKLSKRMMQYWANFARTGNPNSAIGRENVTDAEDLALWTEYGKDGLMVFDIAHSTIEPVEWTAASEHSRLYAHHVHQDWKHCSFWNDYYPLLEGHVRHVVSPKVKGDGDGAEHKDGHDDQSVVDNSAIAGNPSTTSQTTALILLSISVTIFMQFFMM